MGWLATLAVGMVSGIAGLALALWVGDAVATAWSDWQKARTPVNESERSAATSERTFEIRYRVVPRRS